MSEELEFREWLPRVSERLLFILLSIKERKDIDEADWDMLKFFHTIYWMGGMPFFKPKSNLMEEMTVQQKFSGQVDNTAGKDTEIKYEKLD